MKNIISENATMEEIIEKMVSNGYNMKDFDEAEAVENGYFYAYMEGYQDADCFNLKLDNGYYTLSNN